MKKTIYVALIFSVLLSVFSIFSFADDTSRAGVSLMDEMNSNLPNFNPSEYTGGRAMVVGAVEDLQDETCLYLYMYNPDKKDIASGTINLTVNVTSDSGYNESKSFSSIATYCVACTDDNLYVKLRVDLNSIKGILMTGSGYKRNYSWDKLMYKVLNTSGFNNDYDIYFVLQKNNWSFFDSSSGLNVENKVEEVVQLDVNHTWYRTKFATDGKKTKDEIHTVYFSIPEQYTEYYKKLYSVASTYTKKKTNPIVVGTHALYGSTTTNLMNSQNRYRLEYLNRYSIISKDYESVSALLPHSYVSDIGVNIPPSNAASGYNGRQHEIGVQGSDGGWIRYLAYNYFDDFAYYFYRNPSFVKTNKDLDLTDEELLAYIESCEKFGQVPWNLFCKSQSFAWSEKLINQTFDSVAYANQISDNFNKLCEDYGFWCAIQFYIFKNNPEKIQELSEKYLVDAVIDLTEQPYIVLCDNTVLSDIDVLSKTQFCDKYLINEEDYTAVTSYIKNHKNVVLYRYDVCEYISDEVIIGAPFYDAEGFENLFPESMFNAYVMYLYEDFRVIDITFKTEDTFISLAVNSTPQTFLSDPGLEEDIPPIEWNPELDKIPGDIIDALKPLLPDIIPDAKNNIVRILITAAIVILSVTFVVIGTRFVVKGISSGKSKNKKE